MGRPARGREARAAATCAGRPGRDHERVERQLDERLGGLGDPGPELAGDPAGAIAVGVRQRERGDAVEVPQRLRVERADPADADHADVEACRHPSGDRNAVTSGTRGSFGVSGQVERIHARPGSSVFAIEWWSPASAFR